MIFAGVVVGVVGWGFVAQQRYLDHRYVDAFSKKDPRVDAQTVNTMYQWARNVRRSRIGVVGTTFGYPLSGVDISNYVQYVGRKTPHDGFEETNTCREWREEVNAGRYDYVLAFAHDDGGGASREAAWMRGSPNASPVLRAGSSTIFRILGPLDPAQCDAHF
jgi:hypothetical protein